MADPKLSFRFLLSNPAHFIACGFGSGLAPVAPGTFGTLFGWASFVAIRQWLSIEYFAALITVSFLLGIWAIQITGKNCGEVDHGSIVWDEIVPFWTVLLFTPDTFLWQAIAFALFRLFDITKPQPAKWFDTKVKNGFGVMMDDAVAALYSILSIYLLSLWK